jgi:transketolase
MEELFMTATDEALQKVKEAASRVRRSCLDLAFAKSPRPTHFGGGLSGVDILAVLFFSIMKLDKNNVIWADRDRFLLSKGHGVLGYYSTLCEAGLLSRDELFTYGEDGTFLPGHPVINKLKGIEFTNGSLGMGLAVGIGNALAAKKRGKSFRTFVLMGDGECNEGSVWESVMAGSHFQLDNLTAIIDRNSLQQTGKGSAIMNLGDMAEKFRCFGWHSETVDGHDVSSIHDAFVADSNGKPKAIVANTIKGKGFSFSEGNNSWHHGVLTKQLYELGVRECTGA